MSLDDGPRKCKGCGKSGGFFSVCERWPDGLKDWWHTPCHAKAQDAEDRGAAASLDDELAEALREWKRAYMASPPYIASAGMPDSQPLWTAMVRLDKVATRWLSERSQNADMRPTVATPVSSACQSE